jgi:hypothetical protein
MRLVLAVFGAKDWCHEGSEVCVEGFEDAGASAVGDARVWVSDGSQGRSGFLTLISEDGAVDCAGPGSQEMLELLPLFIK